MFATIGSIIQVYGLDPISMEPRVIKEFVDHKDGCLFGAFAHTRNALLTGGSKHGVAWIYTMESNHEWSSICCKIQTSGTFSKIKNIILLFR